MFLDAEGRKLMKHNGPRTVNGFEDALEEVQEFQELVAKTEAGDQKAAAELLIRQLRLEWFDYEEAQKRVAALEKVSTKQKRELAQLLVDTEVRTMAAAAEMDHAKRLEAGKHFLAMWKDKQVPSTDAQLYSFWSIMADYAEDQRDKKLFKKIVGEFKDALQSNSRYRRNLKELERRLENFPKK